MRLRIFFSFFFWISLFWGHFNSIQYRSTQLLLVQFQYQTYLFLSFFLLFVFFFVSLFIIIVSLCRCVCDICMCKCVLNFENLFVCVMNIWILFFLFLTRLHPLLVYFFSSWIYCCDCFQIGIGIGIAVIVLVLVMVVMMLVV